MEWHMRSPHASVQQALLQVSATQWWAEQTSPTSEASVLFFSHKRNGSPWKLTGFLKSSTSQMAESVPLNQEFLIQNLLCALVTLLSSPSVATINWDHDIMKKHIVQHKEYNQYLIVTMSRWTWVCVNSGSWWWTGRPGVLRFMGSQTVGHDWATELTDI